MRRIAIAVMSTISGLVLLLSYHTSQGQGTVAPLGNVTGSSPSGSGSGSSSGSSTTGSSRSGSASGTFTGSTVDTRWGPVQVQITVKGGRITAADAVVFPNNTFHDQQINAYAIPILNQEAVQAQSAQINAVSGATVTSRGYVQSLQSAIDTVNQA